MKNFKIILLVFVATAIAYLIAFPDNAIKKLFSKSGSSSEGDIIEAAGSTAVNSAQPASSSNTMPSSFLPQANLVKDANGFPLVKGDTGDNVAALQRALNDRYGTSLDVDGIFGRLTYRAISSNGYNADAVSYAEYLQILGIRTA